MQRDAGIGVAATLSLKAKAAATTMRRIAGLAALDAASCGVKQTADEERNQWQTTIA